MTKTTTRKGSPATAKKLRAGGKGATSAAGPARSTKRSTSKTPGLSVAAQAAATAKAENARKAEGLVATITEKLRQVEDCFYEVGVALRALAAPGMWGALGAASFDEFVEARTGLSAKTAQRFIRIVEHYDERTAISLTQSKALALLTYVEATPEEDDAETLARKDAQIGGLPISQQSVRGILEAASSVRPAAKRKKRPGEADARAAAASLSKLLVPIRGASTIRTVFRRGQFRLLLDLPVAAVGALRVSAPRKQGA